MIGKLVGLRRLFGGEWEITFSTKEDFSGRYNDLHENPVSIEVKKATKKRSLNANAFAWALIDKIAEKMHMKKTEVYLSALQEVGGITGYVGVKQDFVVQYVASWLEGHTGRDAEILPDSGKPGWVTVKVRLGSSDLDTSQMACFIDILIQEAEQQGIPTARDEADELIRKWNDEKHPAK